MVTFQSVQRHPGVELRTEGLRTDRQSARMSKIKNGGLDQYGTEPFGQQQFGTAGVKGVNEMFI